MLIYQKTSETDKLNILFNVNESAEITTPGDIVLAKTIIGEAPNTESVVSANFTSIDSALEITGSSATTTGNNLVISGQAKLTGGSNVTISATLTLPIIKASTTNKIVCRNNYYNIELPAQSGSALDNLERDNAISKGYAAANFIGGITSTLPGTIRTESYDEFQTPPKSIYSNIKISGWDDKIGSLTAGSFITITGSGDSRTIAVTNATIDAEALKLVQRDSSGDIKLRDFSTTPPGENDAISKSFGDSTYLAKQATITAGTKCKITYDTKGLVTAGADLTATDIPDLSSIYSVVGHTHSYAGASSAGGAATSANKLNTNAGSTVQPVYFSNGVPVATSFSLGKSVPSDAKFTDTTYVAATTLADGLMSKYDKAKLEGITVSTGATKSVTVGSDTLTFGSNAFNSTTIPTTYAGSNSAGGAATSAAKLSNTSKIGDTNKPVYFTANGVPAAISYTIEKSVPSDAKFTDTTYSAATTTTEGLMSAADKTKLDACIELDSGNYYLKAGNVRTKIADIVAQIRCFREDTSYITMYDGTTKLISEVQPGESVLGYDVNKQDYCEALVVSNDRTGEVTTFDCYVFEDGTTVDIDGIDSFLTHYMSNFEGLEPDLTDCFNVSPIDYLYNDSREKNHYFRKVIKSTGGKDNGVAVIYRRKYNCATPTGRYRIQTSNGTCFINGLCHARKPIDTVINFTTGTTAFTPKIREAFANIFARQAKGDPFLPDDHIEDASAAGLLKELTANNAVISLKKDYLNNTDYKAMKYAEGALSEEEWLPIKANRIAAREEINTREARNDEILPLLKTSNPNLMNTYDNKYWWVENIERAMLGFADLNGLLEDFREYLGQ